MKSDEFYELLGEIDETAVSNAETPPVKKKKHTWVYALASTAAAACIALIAVTGVMKHSSSTQVQPKSESLPVSDEIIEAQNMVLAEPVYPEMPMNPNLANENSFNEYWEKWREALSSLRDQPDGYTDGYDSFCIKSMRTFLSDTESENKVYSPLSLYMALGMSAEITGGDTRQQILDVLSHKDIESLRSHARSIWQANYIDDGMAKCVLANSLWTNSNNKYKKETVDRLAGNYYASVYSGDPCTAEYTELMRDRINKQTDGLLEGYVSDLKMEPNMLIKLVSTVNYSGKWEIMFSEDFTKQGTFHSPKGDAVCDFMNIEQFLTYCRSEKFSSLSLPLDSNGVMRFILPDEGVSPEELLEDDEAVSFMTQTDEDVYKNSKYVDADIYVPKFDVSANIDLTEGLESMGITDIFDSGKCDMTPLTDSIGTAVSKAEQDTRVMIDEHGCKAASMTVIDYCGSGIPDEKVTFRLDRPFIFEVIKDAPLFVGIVNDP